MREATHQPQSLNMMPTNFGDRSIRCAGSLSDNTNGMTFSEKNSITARLMKLDRRWSVRYHARVT